MELVKKGVSDAKACDPLERLGHFLVEINFKSLLLTLNYEILMGLVPRLERIDSQKRSILLHDSIYYREKNDFAKLEKAIEENWGAKHRKKTWDFKVDIRKWKYIFFIRKLQQRDEWIVSRKAISDICYIRNGVKS
jgi:hypothetical protein